MSGPQWFIFIERLNDTTINYGVFNYLKLPAAISLEESIYIDRERFCLLLEKDGANVIKISGSKGNKLRVYFSTFHEPSGGGDEVLKFANSCCASLGGEDDFKRYFAGMTNVALAHGHGTILACCKANIAEIPEFKDSIKLDPPVDFREAFASFAEAKSGEALLKLKRAEDLFMGFISCDGIILLDTYGHVVAYRVFFRATKEALPAQEQVVGGARRRAFEGVRQLVGDKLTAALFRSQDGLVLLAGGTE